MSSVFGWFFPLKDKDELKKSQERLKKMEEASKKNDEYIKKMEKRADEGQKRIDEFDEKNKNQEVKVRKVINKIEEWKEIEAMHANDSKKAFYIMNPKTKNEKNLETNDYKGKGHTIGENLDF